MKISMMPYNIRNYSEKGELKKFGKIRKNSDFFGKNSEKLRKFGVKMKKINRPILLSTFLMHHILRSFVIL